MATTDELTTLVCLFHHQDQAHAAVKDLIDAGISQSSISLIGGSGSPSAGYGESSLAELGVPERDQKHLLDGVSTGGMIVAVSAIYDHVDKVEDIFEDHSAEKIDEAATPSSESYAAPLAGGVAAMAAASTIPVAGETAIPIVEEELVVGKRTVDQGGVRVYRRIVEIPVQETVSLREEHVNVERRPVDRAVTDQDLALQGSQTIELTETAEEAVISKNARVVEEVVVGKDATERTERIHDTVRSTEVEIEEIAPDSVRNTRP